MRALGSRFTKYKKRSVSNEEIKIKCQREDNGKGDEVHKKRRKQQRKGQFEY